MTMGEPKVQMCRMMIVPRAVSGVEIQPGPSMPKNPRKPLTMPSLPNTWRQRIAIATDPPSRLGR
jgi:hypothetical protein